MFPEPIFTFVQIKDCYRLVQKVSSVLEEQNVQRPPEDSTQPSGSSRAT